MPKILITGNGFDLSHGLPTLYNDFINILTYLEENSINNYENHFNNIYSKTSTYSDYNTLFQEFDFDIKKIDILKLKIKDNLWYKFFKSEYNIETWIDFENKIEYALKNIFEATEKLEATIFSKGSIRNMPPVYKSSILNNDIEIIKTLEKFNIIKTEGNNLNLNQDYIIKRDKYSTGYNNEKISKKLNDDLLNFKKIFNYYFEIFIHPLYDNLKSTIDTSIYSRINNHFTFNYTPTFEKIYQTSKTSFLHGKINSDLSEIVLGINEIPDSLPKSKHFLPFTKYYQKLDYDTDYEFIKEYERNDKGNFIFFFLGHSLDKSDEEYINEVFNFVNNKKFTKRKIVVIYHNQKSRSNLLKNLLDIRGKKDIVNLMKNKDLIFVNNKSNELFRELNRDITQRSGIRFS